MNKWRGDDIPNRLPDGWTMVCAFSCSVVDMEPAGDVVLVTLEDGSQWTVSEDGKKTMVSNARGLQ